MTQANFNSKYGRLAMPCPFGNNDSANITQIAETASAGDFNFETGFATPYSAPKSNSGKFITRTEINAIGNLASRNDFYYSCGGLNTFDSAIADAINGYPKGAVLDYIVGYKLYKVISLVDANKVDFISNGIDGVNWQYLNLNTVDPSKQEAVSFEINQNSYGPIAVFKAAKDSSTWTIDNRLSIVEESSSTESRILQVNSSYGYIDGQELIILDLGTSPDTEVQQPSFGAETKYAHTETITTSTGNKVVYVPTQITITSDAKGWKHLYSEYIYNVYALAYGEDTSTGGISSHALALDNASSGTGFGAFTGLKKDHYYRIDMKGSFSKRTLTGYETNLPNATLTFATKKYRVEGKFTLYY